jgi:hypothetical protein
MRRVEEENGGKRVVGKAAGDEHAFIPGRGSSWQVKLAQTPYRTRQAVSEDMGSLNRKVLKVNHDHSRGLPYSHRCTAKSNAEG